MNMVAKSDGDPPAMSVCGCAQLQSRVFSGGIMRRSRKDKVYMARARSKERDTREKELSLS
jgi:hypothetical protein